MKGSGKPDDRKGQVRFDVAGAGNGFTVELVRHRQTKETEQIGFTYGTPRQSSTLRIRPIVWSLESAPLFLYGRECRAIRLKALPPRLESFRPMPSVA